MKNRDALTKSLHTVTVVSRLALLIQGNPGFKNATDLELCREALRIVGQPNDYSSRVDDTLQACVDKLKSIRDKGVIV